MVMLKTTLILKTEMMPIFLQCLALLQFPEKWMMLKLQSSCDVCDEKFDSIQTVDPERNIIPVVTVKENGIINGGDLPAFNEVEFSTVHKNYRVITRAFASLQSGSRL